MISPIHEIIVKTNPLYILGKAPTFIANCPLHPNIPGTLQFELDMNRVKMFCHTCHYGKETIDQILDALGLDPEALTIGREMNPVECEFILCKSNLIRLNLEAARLHGLELNDEVRQQYKKIIDEKTHWFERFEKTKKVQGL